MMTHANSDSAERSEPDPIARVGSVAGSAFEPYDLIYALEQAAEFLECEEWPDPDTKAAQEAANKEGARRIRAMANRYANKHFTPSPNKSI